MKKFIKSLLFIFAIVLQTKFSFCMTDNPINDIKSEIDLHKMMLEVSKIVDFDWIHSEERENRPARKRLEEIVESPFPYFFKKLNSGSNSVEREVFKRAMLDAAIEKFNEGCDKDLFDIKLLEAIFNYSFDKKSVEFFMEMLPNVDKSQITDDNIFLCVKIINNIDIALIIKANIEKEKQRYLEIIDEFDERNFLDMQKVNDIFQKISEAKNEIFNTKSLEDKELGKLIMMCNELKIDSFSKLAIDYSKELLLRYKENVTL